MTTSAFFSAHDSGSGSDVPRVRIEDVDRYKKLLHRESYRVVVCELLKPYTNCFTPSDFPILTVGSDTDSYFPESSLKITAEKYSGGKYVLLHGLCHDMMLDPERKKAADAVLDFLNGI